MSKKYRKSNKRTVIIVSFLVAVLIILAYLYHRQISPTRQPAPKATITQLPAQPSPNNGEKQITNASTNNQETATDNNGVTNQNVPPPSEWTSSSNGNLTVKTPSNGSQVANNFELSGVASVEKVQYRLIDSQTGVISQGFINVVNGTFSANVGYKATASTGRLDVFSVDPSGIEINEVQLQVKFK